MQGACHTLAWKYAIALWNRSTLLDQCPFTDVGVRISTPDSWQISCWDFGRGSASLYRVDQV